MFKSKSNGSHSKETELKIIQKPLIQLKLPEIPFKKMLDFQYDDSFFQKLLEKETGPLNKYSDFADQLLKQHTTKETLDLVYAQPQPQSQTGFTTGLSDDVAKVLLTGTREEAEAAVGALKTKNPQWGYYLKRLTFAYGPRNQNSATRVLQRLLIEISARVLPIKFTYSETIKEWHMEAIYQGMETDVISIDHLLRHANLSQLVLSDAEIAGLAQHAPTLQKEPAPLLPASSPFNALPVECQKAISAYTGFISYSLNAFFRGGFTLDDAQRFKTNRQLDVTELLIIGCLVHVGLNRLPALVKTSTETETSKVKLYRRDGLTSEQNAMYRSGMVQTCQLLSTSVNNAFNGTTHFYNSVHTECLEELSHFPKEREVIFPAGTLVFYIPGEKYTHAKVINTPDADVDLWLSTKALRVAYTQSLSKPYKEGLDVGKIGNTQIARMNHGLAQTTRVMLYIEPVIAFFREHAVNSDFAAFCHALSDTEIDKIRAAMAFNVTGRESEASFHGNPSAYMRYRVASAQHFENFAEAGSDYTPNERHIFSGALTHRSEQDHHSLGPHVDYLRWIMDAAHNLDLLRCTSQASCQANCELLLSRTNRSEVALNALRQLYALAMCCLTHMGDNLLVSAAAMNISAPYKTHQVSKPFDVYSTDIRACEYVLLKAPRGIPDADELAWFSNMMSPTTSPQDLTFFTMNQQDPSESLIENIKFKYKDEKDLIQPIDTTFLNKSLMNKLYNINDPRDTNYLSKYPNHFEDYKTKPVINNLLQPVTTLDTIINKPIKFIKKEESLFSWLTSILLANHKNLPNHRKEQILERILHLKNGDRKVFMILYKKTQTSHTPEIHESATWMLLSQTVPMIYASTVFNCDIIDAQRSLWGLIDALIEDTEHKDTLRRANNSIDVKTLKTKIQPALKSADNAADAAEMIFDALSEIKENKNYQLK